MKVLVLSRYLYSLSRRFASTWFELTENFEVRYIREQDLITPHLDEFQRCGEWDYCLIKSPNEVIPSSTVEEAIQDYEFLMSTDWACIRGLNLYSFQRTADFCVDGRVFSITGPGSPRYSWLVHREHVKLVWDCRFFTRTWPPYSLQLLTDKEPYSVRYHRHHGGEWLNVPGFDVGTFTNLAREHGIEEASRISLERLTKSTDCACSAPVATYNNSEGAKHDLTNSE